MRGQESQVVVGRSVLKEPDPDWEDDSLCQSVDIYVGEAFFTPELRHEKENMRLISIAKGICGDCPVKQECLDAAVIRDEQYGIWGGTTPSERRRYVKTLVEMGVEIPIRRYDSGLIDSQILAKRNAYKEDDHYTEKVVTSKGRQRVRRKSD